EALHQDYRSALALAAIGKPSVEGLRELLKEKKVSVRAESAMALGKIGKDAAAAIPDLIGLLADKNERIAGEASLALGRIGTAAVEPITVAAASKDPVVRAHAVTGLGYVSESNSKVREILLKCAHDEAPPVRQQAVTALSRMSMPDDALLPILTENV